MTPTEIITVCISTFALVASVVAIAMQYGHRNNVQFKVTKTELVSHQPEDEQDRSFAIVLNISIFNMGNAPIVLDALSLSLDGKINAASYDHDTQSPSSRTGDDLLIPPMSPEAYNELAFRPVVVESGSIHSKEVVFNLFYFEIDQKYLTAKGDLNLTGIFYNAKGNQTEVNAHVAEINIKGVRGEDSSYNINFYKNNNELQKVEF